MKLVVAIVRDQDAGRAVDNLISREYRATRINTAGGFLKRGNATILIGVDDEQVDEILELLQDTVRQTGGDGKGVAFVLPVAATFKA
jgi:uncharacterized protein YaaQ